jgi:acyl carrier protein
MEEIEVKENLRKIISKLLEVDIIELEDEKEFGSFELYDSLLAMDILTSIEGYFKIKIPENYFDNLKNLNDSTGAVLNLISKK